MIFLYFIKISTFFILYLNKNRRFTDVILTLTREKILLLKIIPPDQITTEIRRVIQGAEEYVILVSPYVNFTNWNEIKSDISNALKRKVKVKFYSRMEYENFKSWEHIDSTGIKPLLIKNLHAKLYFSEKSGIVTSMNLLASSNFNAIEFGSIYNLKNELDELKYFVKTILKPNVIDKPNDEEIYFAKEKFTTVLRIFLSNNFNRDVSCKYKNNLIEFKIDNQFYLFVDKVTNSISVSGIISGMENDNYDVFEKEHRKEKIDYQLNEGSISASIKKSFSNSNFDFLRIYEKKEILEFAAEFANSLLIFKKTCYQKHKANR